MALYIALNRPLKGGPHLETKIANQADREKLQTDKVPTHSMEILSYRVNLAVVFVKNSKAALI